MLRETGVRHAEDRPGKLAAQLLDMRTHLLRAGGAVDAEDIYIHRQQGRCHRIYIRTDQQRAVVLDGDRNNQRQLCPAVGHCILYRQDCSLDLQQIL